ncbi:unnamed protein product [Symbiodinium sp. CCMP2592]|nr:unnamed protein product [Symbiodinium sp. CCMP2592]
MNGAATDPQLQVPVKEIQRLKYPEEISPELFEEFAAKSEPVIIEGLIADWPAFADAERNWQKSRWDDLMRDEVLDVGFDPADSRMMHFGDDSGEPEVLFNPGRLRLPAWAFREVALLRQDILRLREEEGGVDLAKHENLRRRLSRERRSLNSERAVPGRGCRLAAAFLRALGMQNTGLGATVVLPLP